MTNLRDRPLPPPELERRVVARLRSEGLINNLRENDMKKIHLTWALAATVLLVVGVFIGRMPAASQAENGSAASQAASESVAGGPGASRAETAIADARSQYALLLYEDASYQVSAQPDSSDRVAEYSEWARNLAADGTIVGGEKLADSGLLLSPNETGSRLPQSDMGALAGYFVIRAQDENDAARIAATCPHLKYGGRISLRRIET